MSKKKKTREYTDPKEKWSYKHVYPIEEVWNTDNTIAQLIVPRLQAFKALDKHGHSTAFKDMREWDKTIQKMIDAFDLMKYAGSYTLQKKKRLLQKVWNSSASISVAFGINNKTIYIEQIH